MLSLTRHPGQSLHIGDDITVKAIDCNALRIKTATTISGKTTINFTLVNGTLELADDISVSMRLSHHNNARLGISAPIHIPVHRSEIIRRILTGLRSMSIYEVCAEPNEQQSSAIHTYIVASTPAEALNHFSQQFDREWLISPWVVTTHWQPSFMYFVDAGMDNSVTYKAMRSACLLRQPPFIITLPHLGDMGAAA